jgi:L-glutamine synthetase (EC 6.3.1.2)
MYDQDEEVAQMSQIGRYYVGGILNHASALCAISNPTTNSYKRLVPGFEAPVNVCWGLANRSTAIRIPMYNRNQEKSKRIEYRVPDPTANIYLLEAALLLAGLDGIKIKLIQVILLKKMFTNFLQKRKENIILVLYQFH